MARCLARRARTKAKLLQPCRGLFPATHYSSVITGYGSYTDFQKLSDKSPEGSLISFVDHSLTFQPKILKRIIINCWHCVIFEYIIMKEKYFCFKLTYERLPTFTISQYAVHNTSCIELSKNFVFVETSNFLNSCINYSFIGCVCVSSQHCERTPDGFHRPRNKYIKK